MRIKIKNTDVQEIQMIMEFLSSYLANNFQCITASSKNYFDAVLKIDMARSMYYMLRKKTESDFGFKNKKIDCSLSPSQAVILLEAIQKHVLNNESTNHLKNKLIQTLHEQLINL